MQNLFVYGSKFVGLLVLLVDNAYFVLNSVFLGSCSFGAYFFSGAVAVFFVLVCSFLQEGLMFPAMIPLKTSN